MLSLSDERLQFGLIDIIAISKHCILTKQFHMTAFHSCPQGSQQIPLIQLRKLFPSTTGWAPSCSFPPLMKQCTIIIKHIKTITLQQVQVMFNPFSDWPRGNSFTCEVKGLYKPWFSYQSQPLSKRFLEVPALLQVDEALKIWDDLAKRQHLKRFVWEVCVYFLKIFWGLI